MSSLPLVIVNPTSARAATRDSWPSMASDLRAHFGPFNCIFTERAGHGRILAAQAATEGRRLIIACGGDGTISEVANGILESGADAELGILPSGTGGDFRRTLGVSANTVEAARSLNRGLTRRMDVGRVTYRNHEGREESRYFLGVASFGMSPAIIERVKADGPASWQPGPLRRVSGKLSFAAATLRTTLEAASVTIRVQIDEGPERRLTVRNLCIANARYFGGGMKIAPEALLDDALLDVISIGDMDALEILRHGPRLYFGKHLSLRQVAHGRAHRITALPSRADERIAIEIDGELPGHLPATFEILPLALSIRAPA